MAFLLGHATATSKTILLYRGGAVVGLLCLMVLGGFSASGFHSTGSPALSPAMAPSVSSGSTLLASASQSLAQGAGPAQGVPASCTLEATTASQCSAAASANPRPAISANDTWINLTKSLVGGASSGPGAMYLGVMVYDAYDGYIVYFGGSPNGGTFSQATWIYSQGQWTELSESNPPGARYIEQMAYDPGANAVILFSGYQSGTCPADTWSFSNGTWTQLPATGPDGRYRGDFTYDADMNAMILTGGSNCAENYFYKDTWEFANDTWTNITSLVTGTPPGVVRAEMVWDAFDHEIVLFGGTDSSGSGNDETWTFANMTWSESVLSPTPSARTYFQMVYDPQKSAVILFGGSPTSDSGTCYQDTWEFQGGNWTKLTPLVSPPVRGYGMMAYYPPGGYVLLNGGYTNTEWLSDTWAFGADAVVWGNATPPALDAGLTTVLNITVVSPLKNLSINYWNLPTGCTSSNVTQLSCTPNQYGNFDILAAANDSIGDNASTNISLEVREDPTVNGFVFSPSTVDVGYPTQITANVTGGTLPLTYNWTKLPPGCASANQSSISCTPNSTGLYPISLTVKDLVNFAGIGSSTLQVNATPSIQKFYASPAAIDLGQTVTLDANVFSGTPPYAYNWSNLPVGCSSANLASIKCTPVAPGPYVVEATASDAFNATISGNISFTVNQDLVVNSVGVSPGTVDSGVKITLYENVSYGTLPYSYSFSGVPAGCTPTNTKASTCTPTATGTFTITGKVTDATGAVVASRTFKLTVVPDPIITGFNATPTATDVGKSTTLTVNASQGSGSFTYVYSGLPEGCSSSNAASITCSPLVAGHSTVSVSVTDSEGKSATSSLNLTVGATPALAVTVSPASVNTGQSVTFTVTTTGGVSPFTYKYAGLPSGCSSTNSATLTCAPSATGTFTITVTGTDQATSSAQGSTQLVVKSPTSTSFLGLPLVAGVGIVVVVLLVVVLAIALVMRRRRKPPAMEAEPAGEPPSN